MAKQGEKFTCIKVCYYRKRLWKIGEKLVANEGENVPHFFKSGDAKIEQAPVPEAPRTLSEVQKAEADAVKKGPLSFLD